MKDSDVRDIAGLVLELEGYVREGIILRMNGKTCSPVNAAQVCLLREKECYMRDYVCDEANRVVEIRFDKVDPIPKEYMNLYHFNKEK